MNANLDMKMKAKTNMTIMGYDDAEEDSGEGVNIGDEDRDEPNYEDG